MTSLAAGHVFWWALTATCLLWYSTITIYVAVKGLRDIRRMVRRLKDGAGEEPPQH